MLLKVNSKSHHCLFGDLPSDSNRVQHTELRQQLIHFSLKYQGVERPNLLDLSCRLRFKCGMTFPTLCLTPERWMGSGMQEAVGYFPELCFLQVSEAQLLVGLRTAIYKQLCFPTSLGLCCWF